MPGISCKPASLMSFFRSLRCEPITKRCASSRSRWMKYSTGSRGSSLMASRSGIAVRAFCNGHQGDLGQSETLENFPDGVELAAAAVDDDEVGPLRKRIIVGV